MTPPTATTEDDLEAQLRAVLAHRAATIDGPAPPLPVAPALAAVVPLRRRRWIVGAVAALAVGDTWPLLIVSALGALSVGVLGIRLSLRHGHRLGAVLFVVYMIGTLVLPPLAARPEQSQQLQWGEQLTNSLVQLCFLIGALGIRRRAGAVVPAPTPIPSPIHERSTP